MSSDLSLAYSDEPIHINVWNVFYLMSILYLVYKLYFTRYESSKLETIILNMTTTHNETFNTLYKRLDQYDIQMNAINNRFTNIEEVNKDIKKDIEEINTTIKNTMSDVDYLLDSSKNWNNIVKENSQIKNQIDTIKNQIESKIESIITRSSEDIYTQIEIINKMNTINKTINNRIDKEIVKYDTKINELERSQNIHSENIKNQIESSNNKVEMVINNQNEQVYPILLCELYNKTVENYRTNSREYIEFCKKYNIIDYNYFQMEKCGYQDVININLFNFMLYINDYEIRDVVLNIQSISHNVFHFLSPYTRYLFTKRKQNKIYSLINKETGKKLTDYDNIVISSISINGGSSFLTYKIVD
jgi:DNA repair exonuclease SbcCD ATPase subunit